MTLYVLLLIATKVNMFTTFVAMAMISLGNFRQRLSEAVKDKGLEDISNHDDLTGIANMHHFRSQAVRMLEKAAEEDRVCAFEALARWEDPELGMISLAEGVETREQYEFLKKNGCDRMQGYLFSKPLPGDEIVKLFENGTLKA